MVKIDDIVEQMSVNPFTMYSEYRLQKRMSITFCCAYILPLSSIEILVQDFPYKNGSCALLCPWGTGF